MNEPKYASNGIQFRAEAKEFVINMLGEKRKLHKKCGCPWAGDFAEYFDFDSEEEAKDSGIEYTHCGICFKGE